MLLFGNTTPKGIINEISRPPITIENKLIKKEIYNECGYILPYVLFICFLTFTLVIGVISYLFLINKINIRKIEKKKLELACYSALQKEMFDKNSVPVKNKKIYINDIEVNIIHREKGVYREIITSAKNSRDSSCVKYLIANYPPLVFSNAIIISGYGFKPIVTGETEIYGDISPAVTVLKSWQKLRR